MYYVTMILSPCRMSLSRMSHVEFKKCQCRCVDFRGLGPFVLCRYTILHYEFFFGNII